MNFFPSLLTTIAIAAAPLFAQADPSDATAREWSYEVRAGADGLVHQLNGSQEVFLGAVMISLSPKTVPYAPGLPPSLTDFVTIGACFGKAGQAFVFACPIENLPLDVQIFSQAALLNEKGLHVSEVLTYKRTKAGVAMGDEAGG